MVLDSLADFNFGIITLPSLSFFSSFVKPLRQEKYIAALVKEKEEGDESQRAAKVSLLVDQIHTLESPRSIEGMHQQLSIRHPESHIA